jgi:hypothetical protein
MEVVNLIADGGQEKSLVGLSGGLPCDSVPLEDVEGVGGEGDGEVGEFSVCSLGLQNVKNILKLRKGLGEVVIDRKERLSGEVSCQFIHFA